jgi:hypothetical protein
MNLWLLPIRADFGIGLTVGTMPSGSSFPVTLFLGLFTP